MFFIIKLCADHNTLCVKHTTHQKAQSSRATSISKLDNTVNNNSIFNTKYAEFSTKCQVFLHFHNTSCAYKHLLQSPPKIRSSTSAKFHLPIPLLIVHKIVLSIPTNSSFLCTSAIFHLPIFVYYHPNNLHPKYFPHLSHLANSGSVKGSGSQVIL